MYARDTSRKIRSSLKTKMSEGDFIGSHPPYGYIRNPDNRHHLIPDPLSSQVVAEIFKMAALGKSPREISLSLSQQHIVPPLEFRQLRKTTYPGDDTQPPHKTWSPATILKILHNPVYLGHMVQGKRKKLSFKSKTCLSLPMEDWVWVENTHQPLTAPYLFDMANRWLKMGGTSSVSSFSNLLSGIAFCADCHSPMSTVNSGKKGRAMLACGSYKAGKGCSNHLIPYDDLLFILKEEISRPLSPLLICAMLEEIRIGQSFVDYSGENPVRRQAIHISFTEESPAWQWASAVMPQELWDAELSTLPGSE